MADEMNGGAAAVVDAPVQAETTSTVPAPQIDVGAHFEPAGSDPATNEPKGAPKASAAEPTSTSEPAGDAPAPEPKQDGEPAYDPAKVGKLMGEFEAMLQAQRAQALNSASQPAPTPAAPAPAATPATPTTAPDPFAPIMEAATKEYGAELGDKVLKPLVDAFKGEIKALRDSMSPAQAMASQMAMAAQAHVEQKVHAFLDKFPAVYGKDSKERASNPVYAKAFQEDVLRGAELQKFFASRGRQLSDEDALAMAHSARTKEQPASEARQTVVNDLKRRSNQRSAPPAATSGGGGDPAAALQAEINKHYERR